MAIIQEITPQPKLLETTDFCCQCALSLSPATNELARPRHSCQLEAMTGLVVQLNKASSPSCLFYAQHWYPPAVRHFFASTGFPLPTL